MVQKQSLYCKKLFKSDQNRYKNGKNKIAKTPNIAKLCPRILPIPIHLSHINGTEMSKITSVFSITSATKTLPMRLNDIVRVFLWTHSLLRMILNR